MSASIKAGEDPRRLGALDAWRDAELFTSRPGQVADVDLRTAGPQPDRHTIAIAGDHKEAAHAVADLVDQFGFDPIIAGRLAAGAAFGLGRALVRGFDRPPQRTRATERRRRPIGRRAVSGSLNAAHHNSLQPASPE